MTRARGGRPRNVCGIQDFDRMEQEPRNAEKATNTNSKFVGSSYNIGPGESSRDYRIATFEMRQLQPVDAKLLLRIS